MDKKKIVSYLEVFQQIVGFNFIVNWHQTIFSSLSLHKTFIGWGGVLPSVVRTRKCRPPRAKSAISQPTHVMLQKCSWATWPQKTRFINKDKRAKISRLVIDVIFRLLAVRCLWLERSIVKIPFKKNHIKCPCENPIVLWSNVLH